MKSDVGNEIEMDGGAAEEKGTVKSEHKLKAWIQKESENESGAD